MEPPPSYPGLAETPSTPASAPAAAPAPAPAQAPAPAKSLIVQRPSPFVPVFVGLMVLTSMFYWYSVRQHGM